MSNWGESTLINLLILSSFEFNGDEMCEKFLGLNHGQIDLSGNFLLVNKLDLHELWKSTVKRETPWGQSLLDEVLILNAFVGASLLLLLIGASFEQFIELINQMLISRDMLQKPFWNENTSEILTLFCSFLYCISDSVYDIGESFTSESTLFGDDEHIWVSLEGALKSQMRWVLTHQTNEIPILDGRGTVGEHVSYKLRVDLGGRVETDGSLEELMSNVTIEGGWNNNDVGWNSLINEVLGKSGSLSVGMSGTDKNDTSDAVLFARGADGLELFLLELDFSGVSEVVRTTKVSVWGERLFGDGEDVVADDTFITVDVSYEGGTLLLALISEKTIDDVVGTWGLVAEDDDSDLGSMVSIEWCSKFRVQLFQKWVVRLVITLLSEDSVLDLYEVGTEFICIQVFELLANLGLDELTVWRILLARAHPEVGLGQAVWKSDFSSNSGS